MESPKSEWEQVKAPTAPIPLTPKSILIIFARFMANGENPG